MRSLKPSVSSPGMALGLAQNTFTYDELKIATDDFSNLHLLGQGGFGYVHRGVLSSGKVVAIKQLKAESRQGEREFQAEVEIISRIHHRHLVSLIGYCISGPHRILVYEFVPNGTLEFHLHGEYDFRGIHVRLSSDDALSLSLMDSSYHTTLIFYGQCLFKVLLELWTRLYVPSILEQGICISKLFIWQYAGIMLNFIFLLIKLDHCFQMLLLVTTTIA